MQVNFSSVIHLLHSCSSGVLATHSQQLDGYPYATLLPFALDESHRPLFLVSSLAEHTKNLLTDRRVSFLLSAATGKQVLSAARLTLVGDVEPITPEEALINRYLRYQPDAKQYLELGDFMFFRMNPKRARYIAGFAQMGWTEGEEWIAAAAVPLPDEERILHMASQSIPKRMRLLGIDCYGVDAECDGRQERHQFANAPVDVSLSEESLTRYLQALS
jgi:heme iron utilization protein